MSRSKFLRRVQKIKTGSYIISIPMDWVVKNNVKPHDHVIVIEDPNNNIIVKLPKTYCYVTINVDNYAPETVADMVKVMYMYGADRIELTSTNSLKSEVISVVRGLRSDLMGFEIESMGKSSMVIVVKDSVEYLDKENFLKYFLKSFRLLRESLEDICRCLEPNGTETYISDVKERMYEAKRFYRYLYRLLSLAMKEPERNGLPSVLHSIYLEMTMRLREISYYIHRMVDFIPHVERGPHMEKLRDICELTVRAMRSKADIDAVSRIRAEVNRFEEELISRGVGPHEAHTAFALRRIIHDVLRITESFAAASFSETVKCVSGLQEAARDVDQEELA